MKAGFPSVYFSDVTPRKMVIRHILYWFTIPLLLLFIISLEVYAQIQASPADWQE